MTHSLKCDPVPFAEIASGQKTCEVRKDDRGGGFEVGDLLELWEFDRDNVNAYTGLRMGVLVTHVQRGYGLPEGLVVLSIKRLGP